MIQTLGEGAMGSVWLARQPGLERTVAIKRMLGRWDGDPPALERFRREARALARMNHPNVVQVYSLETEGLDLLLVMEYVPGPTLASLIASGPLAPGASLQCLAGVAAAVAYAHSRGIVHRDLKPANVLVRPDGMPKVGDFGLARMGRQASGLTLAGQVLGSPAYMSPEQARGEPATERSDLYSLAVIAYELLTGEHPFAARDSAEAMLRAQTSEVPPMPSERHPGFSRAVERVLLAALAKEASHRPDGVTAFMRDLQRAGLAAGWAPGGLAEAVAGNAVGFAPARGQAAATRPAGGSAETAVGGGVDAAATVAPTGPAPAGPGRAPVREGPLTTTVLQGQVFRFRRRRLGWVAALAVALVLVVGAALAWLWPRAATGPFRVESATLAVEPDRGTCPSATFDFTATLVTAGGAGVVEYQWTRPDGTTAGPERLAVPEGTSTALLRLRFTFAGATPREGGASLRVISPGAAAAGPARVTYACP